MAIDKTLTDVYRRELDLDRYSVFEALPAHFDDKYPKLVNFLQEYYKTFEETNNPVEKLNDLLLSRDITGAKEELLTFISSELLLGKPYFESFNDKRTALQFSNLLYRSKGTEFSIKQFFRVFYGLDIDVRYGKDEVFYLGDVNKEEMIFSGGNGAIHFPYTYKGSELTISVQDSDGEYRILRQDTDYTINFSRQVVSLSTLDSAGQSLDSADSIISSIATNGLVPASSTLKIFATRDTFTTIGSDVTNKYITNDKFYQLYGLLISAPIGVPTWKDAYKTFVHPAGMYLAGQVSITSIYDFNLGPQNSFIEPPAPVQAFSNASVMKRVAGVNEGIMTTSITEIAEDSDGNFVRTRVNDMSHPYKISGWHTQYGTIARADDIAPRSLDDTFADLSNVINTLDENSF